MQIFLHNLDGTQQVLFITESTTIQDLLNLCPASRFVYQGAILKSLDALTENSNIYATGDLDGGKKKKKKKAFTTKKKNKHIHKKIKLLPLSLYAVDGNTIFIQVKEISLNKERLAHHAVQELSWPNIGIVITADFATQPSRWMLRQ